MDKKDVVIIDTETNALKNPSKIHVICTRTFDNETKEFLNVLSDPSPFFEYIKKFPIKAGHNFVQYDLHRVLDILLPGHGIDHSSVIDTLVLSKLIKYDITGGHSLEVWGERFGIKKEGTDLWSWEDFDPVMVSRCHSDTLINLKLLDKYWRFVVDPEWQDAIALEHYTARVCAEMTDNGFPFNKEGAEKLYAEIKALLDPIDRNISEAFPPRAVPVREVTPRLTKSGTLNLQDFKWFEGNDLSGFTEGAPFTVISFEKFNPGSPQQVVQRLNEAGWKPTEKTKGHISALKDKKTSKEKLERYKEYGWKISEENLKTLPDSAPQAAKSLGRRIILQSRLSDLEEWLALAVNEGDFWNVHGRFNELGAWTHRLSHSKPNLANVPVAKRSPKDTEFETLINDLNDDMRSLWVARPGCRLVGTDADGLQMRIFAHIVNDKELIDALIKGTKEDKTDIHSVHQRKLGEPCKSRDSAKTFIYAWLLGAGTGKVAEILETTTGRAKTAVDSFIESYPGLKVLKSTIIPRDAARGYFVGLDGRKVVCSSEHLMLAGYLQNGEAIIMKGACRVWQTTLRQEKIPFRLATWPHDEWQTEIPDDEDICKFVQQVQIQSIRAQAERLQMNCPLDAKSVWGYTWKDTH